MSEVASSSSASAAESSVDVLSDANSKLSQGKRHLVCGEVLSAVNILQEACQLLAGKYGETANEVGETYFYYGKALLELGRMENGVLGNALQGVSVESEDESKPVDDKIESPEKLEGEERKKVHEEVQEALSTLEDKNIDKKDEDKKEDDKKDDNKQDGEDVPKDDKDAKAEEKVDKDEGKEEDKTEEGTSQEEGDEDGEEGDTAEEGAEGDTADDEDIEGEAGESTAEESKEAVDADDVPNFQLAWEVLELANVIFSRQEPKDMQLKSAQCHLSLGEIGLETENYERSIEDFSSCLKIQKASLEAEDRLIAETHYQLGMAYGFSRQFDQAIEQYKEAIKVLEAKIASLNKVVSEAESKGDKGKSIADGKDPAGEARKEIADVQEILPEIRAKIEDCEEEKKAPSQMKDITKEALQSSSGFSAPSTSGTAQPIAFKKAGNGQKPSDISSLVRKKRKPEEENCTNGDESKKARQENGSGDCHTNGTTNGNGTDQISPEKQLEAQVRVVVENIKVKSVEDVQKSKESTETSV